MAFKPFQNNVLNCCNKHTSKLVYNRTDLPVLRNPLQEHY